MINEQALTLMLVVNSINSEIDDYRTSDDEKDINYPTLITHIDQDIIFVEYLGNNLINSNSPVYESILIESNKEKVLKKHIQKMMLEHINYNQVVIFNSI